MFNLCLVYILLTNLEVFPTWGVSLFNFPVNNTAEKCMNIFLFSDQIDINVKLRGIELLQKHTVVFVQMYR